MMILATYIVTGALAGFLAGLLGIGGGLIVVPVLVVSFTMQGFAPDVIMPLAVGTSLATIVVTSSISIRAHHARGNIDWRIFKPTAPGIFVGAVLGLTLSAYAPTQLMQIAFIVYACVEFAHDARHAGGEVSGVRCRAVPDSIGYIYVPAFIAIVVA